MRIAGVVERTPRHAALGRASDPAERRPRGSCRPRNRDATIGTAAAPSRTPTSSSSSSRAPGDPKRAAGVRGGVGGMPCLPGSLRAGERQQHPVEAGEPERRDRDGDREPAIVAVAKAQQRQHLLPPSAPPILISRSGASARARACRLAFRPRRSRRASRVGDRIAEGERGAILEGLVALADDADDARVSLRTFATCFGPRRVGVPGPLDHCLQGVLIHRPAETGGGDHRLRASCAALGSMVRTASSQLASRRTTAAREPRPAGRSVLKPRRWAWPPHPEG